jgi:hypothetical protein
MPKPKAPAARKRQGRRPRVHQLKAGNFTLGAPDFATPRASPVVTGVLNVVEKPDAVRFSDRPPPITATFSIIEKTDVFLAPRASPNYGKRPAQDVIGMALNQRFPDGVTFPLTDRQIENVVNTEWGKHPQWAEEHNKPSRASMKRYGQELRKKLARETLKKQPPT